MTTHNSRTLLFSLAVLTMSVLCPVQAQGQSADETPVSPLRATTVQIAPSRLTETPEDFPLRLSRNVSHFPVRPGGLPRFATRLAGRQTEEDSGTRPSSRHLYLHLFRAPSTGLEYRQGNMGVHAGLYTTILGERGRSTEFIKAGVTGYYALGSRRLEGYLSVAYLRGLNRDYNNRDGIFIEHGARWALGNGLELRAGVGVLAASGRATHLNPTIGLTWRIPIR